MKRYFVHRHTSPGPLEWSRACVLTDFTFPWEPTSPPRTEFRALWSDSHLHFKFECDDADLVLGDGVDEKERVLGSDRVEIFFTPSLTLSPYYAFEMEPRGGVLAYSARHYREYDWGWCCPELKVEARIEGAGYGVEGSLPLTWLRKAGVLRPGSSEFHAGVFRAEFSRLVSGGVHQGWMPWVNPGTPRADFHVPGAFGVFELCD